jgi:hypothetical protein
VVVVVRRDARRKFQLTDFKLLVTLGACVHGGLRKALVAIDGMVARRRDGNVWARVLDARERVQGWVQGFGETGDARALTGNGLAQPTLP